MSEERDKAIAEYLPYARKCGQYWGNKFPHLREDLMAVALLALVQAFEAEPDPVHPKGYVSMCIRNCVFKFLNNNSIIKIPSQEIKRRQRAEKSLDDLPRATPTENIDSYGREAPSWLRMHVADIFRLLNLTKAEREIIELRMYGFTLAEIGAMMDRTKSTIHWMISNIQDRYRRLAENKKHYIRRFDDV